MVKLVIPSVFFSSKIMCKSSRSHLGLYKKQAHTKIPYWTNQLLWYFVVSSTLLVFFFSFKFCRIGIGSNALTPIHSNSLCHNQIQMSVRPNRANQFKPSNDSTFGPSHYAEKRILFHPIVKVITCGPSNSNWILTRA